MKCVETQGRARPAGALDKTGAKEDEVFKTALKELRAIETDYEKPPALRAMLQGIL